MALPIKYEVGSFLVALQSLGVRLSASDPLSRRAVLQAYRDQVKRHHPDQFRSGAEVRRATTVLRELNDARDYVRRHFDQFVWPPLSSRDQCVAACAEYANIWPVDPRD